MCVERDIILLVMNNKQGVESIPNSVLVQVIDEYHSFTLVGCRYRVQILLKIQIRLCPAREGDSS